MKPFSVALADDHVLIRNGLAGLINTFDGYHVSMQAINGQELADKIKAGQVPDVILLDINMPKKDGYETAHWLKNNYPDVKVLALSMYDNETAIIRMLKNGARGYVLKDAEPSDLKRALDDVVHKGFYYSELVTGHLINTIHKMGDDNGNGKNILQLNDREVDFLKYACTELTYKEIADKMYLSPRTIDGYRDALFEKLNIKTRVGLAIYAIKNGIVNIDDMN
ncbi:response regulator transcription factor [Foetidibacter luteolus]|uniref:response regulator transcription factor n=1 Tax=Foetidibacter luteolus TaxID=2608880 RepID=UPI00129B5BDF|nr:response regulator transcription factor [Foetidibacter luteolus]